jgi:hypothetical protein
MEPTPHTPQLTMPLYIPPMVVDFDCVVRARMERYIILGVRNWCTWVYLGSLWLYLQLGGCTPFRALPVRTPPYSFAHLHPLPRSSLRL